MGLLTSSCCCHLPTFFGLHFQHTGPWIKLSRAAGLNQSLTLASISEKSCQSQWCRQTIHHSSYRRCQRIGRHCRSQSHQSDRSCSWDFIQEPRHPKSRAKLRPFFGNLRTFFRLLWWSSGRWSLHGNSSACNSACIFGGVWQVVLQALDLIAFQRPIRYYGSSSDCYNLCCWRSDTTLKQPKHVDFGN